ncbi:Uma2 family endonuclease [Spirulina subsalsa FACHB-351]|uniref:Uma2 family endonuclease n=1 Tax=Spirulina subsalsa FACHB-351 TaxID=234711 RepID=A0ABT3L9U3_9CYAN|nr:Uma2 family endonuclease [Spirulina subsalsa]MCW6038272.1 Uma2 family endonuclease [Spirulina subsalsa FACHB-351]
MITTIQPPQATLSKEMSLEEFLQYDDGSDSRYELEDGRLLYMPSESDINQRIAMFLLAYFLQLGLPFYRLRIGTELAVMGSRATVRLPDLMVLTEELAQAMSGATRSIILSEMPPPDLVVEVVSPGRENEERDYRYKRAQYQARGIREYWIIDPMQQQITVLRLVTGLYEEAIFRGEEGIVSELLTQWGQREPLTVAQVLQVG